MTYTTRPLLSKNRVRAGRQVALVPKPAHSTAPGDSVKVPVKKNDAAVTESATDAKGRVVLKIFRTRLSLRKHAKKGKQSSLRLRFGNDAWQAIIERKVAEAIAERIPFQSPSVVAARQRGATWARTDYANPENLSLDQAAAHTGTSARVINERRNKWIYFGLIPKGQQRGFRFPKWQFDAEPGRLSTVLAVLREANANCWTVHSFMNTRATHLDGMTPREWIFDPQADLPRLLQLARARFTSDQGAG